MHVGLLFEKVEGPNGLWEIGLNFLYWREWLLLNAM